MVDKEKSFFQKILNYVNTGSQDTHSDVAEYDPEARFRSVTPKVGIVILISGIILSLFHIYTAGFGVLQEYEHRSVHLMFSLFLVFLVFNIRKAEPSRIRSFIDSSIYAFIGAFLLTVSLGGFLQFAKWGYILHFAGIAFSLFYFKERVWFSSKVVPLFDVVISFAGLFAVAYFTALIWPKLGSIYATSGWKVILWGIGTLGIPALFFGYQIYTSLWQIIVKGRGSFQINPRQVPYFDVVFAILAFSTSCFIIVDFEQFIDRAGFPHLGDQIIGAITIGLVLEATRRSVGVPLTVIALLAIGYCYAGPYLSGLPVLDSFAHRGYSVDRIVEYMFSGTDGIFGIPLGVCATFVFHFILFGLFISYTGLGQLFIDMAMSLAGWSAGGPAKVSVIASGFLGSISGSAIANTVTTGSFTIPLMKRVGYRPVFAGAVEASASSGGQIMPPIMGAAAFIMAEFLGISYIKIAIAAIIPAILHFYAIGIMVHFEALKVGMKGLPKEELPKFGDIIKERGILLLPLGIIVYLLVAGFTPFLAAFWAIIITCSLAQCMGRMRVLYVPVFMTLPTILFKFNPLGAVLTGTLLFKFLGVLFLGLVIFFLVFFQKRSLLKDFVLGLIPVAVFLWFLFIGEVFFAAVFTNLAVIALGVCFKESKMRLPQILSALQEGAKSSLAITAAVACVGLIVGTTMLTGLGLKFGNLTISLAESTADFFLRYDFFHILPTDGGTTLFMLMVFTAVACFVLGMGLPTTAQYIVAAVIAAPALSEFGINPLITHMFCFFYAILADVTPPVALASYAAAGVSGADPFKTGTISFSLSSAKYCIPFIFVSSPVILFLPTLLDPDVTFFTFFQKFPVLEFIAVVVSVFIGVTGLGAGMRGYLADKSTKLEQTLCLVAALLFFVRGYIPFIVGLIMLGSIYFIQHRRRHAREQARAV